MQTAPANSSTRGFTLVEVLMASAILVVGFMGMIQAVTIGSEMLATARRQTLAAQIINHELEKLRLKSWSNGTDGINDLPVGTTTVSINAAMFPAVADIDAFIKSYGLTTDTSVSTNPYITVERTVTDVFSGSLREITITVTWQKSGTTTAATTASGSWLEQLSFSGSAPIQRTYVRKGSGFFGKYGLNLSHQRS